MVAPPSTRPPRRRRRRGRRVGIAALVLLLLMAAPAYSYTTTMLQPSSLPLWPRSVEWLRAHHGNWFVDEVEHYYYSWKAPSKGGPQLKSLPTVGVGPPRGSSGRRTGATAAVVPPPRSSACSHTRCRARACGAAPARSCDGRPPVLVTTFRTEVDYPRIVAYVAWFDHTRTSRRVLPGPLRAAERAGARADVGALRTSAGGCSRPSTAASSTRDGNNGSSINGHGVRAAARPASRP